MYTYTFQMLYIEIHVARTKKGWAGLVQYGNIIRETLIWNYLYGSCQVSLLSPLLSSTY